ncbi:MAG: hypothetical protein LBG44_10255 [Gemmatimonadota bacterium]|jgi:hypothetical protein|nr:hypothetical protein [Gemmatimonadota bacterium]
MAQQKGKGASRAGGGQASPPDARRKAAIAALVSTVLLFVLLLGGAWLGGVVYDALPVGPFPKSRIISSGITVLILIAGYLAYNRAVVRLTQRGRSRAARRVAETGSADEAASARSRGKGAGRSRRKR